MGPAAATGRLLSTLMGSAVVLVIAATLYLGAQFDSFVGARLEGTPWSLLRLENEALRFDFELDLANHDPAKSLETVRMRFDILYGRITAMLQGRELGRLGEGDHVAGLARNLQGFLALALPLMDGEDAGLRSGLVQLMAETRILSDHLRRTSIEVMQESGLRDDQRKARFMAVVWIFILAIVTLILALCLRARAMQRLTQMAHGRQQQLERLALERAQTIEASLDPIIVFDQQGLVRGFNTAAAQTFAWPTEAAIGVPIAAFVDADDPQQFLISTLGRVAATGLRRGGGAFPVEMSISSNPTDQGLRFTVFLRDLSQRIEAENAILAARDAALASAKAKADFLGVMSHEMRTPLNGVLAALELLTPRGPGQAELLAAASLSAKALHARVEAALDLSADPAPETAQDPFDLAELVQATLAPLRDKGPPITVLMVNDFPALFGDAARLCRVLGHLVSNAVTCSRASRVDVELEAVEVFDAAITLEIRVTDDGIGIEQTDQEHIFEPFVVLDPTYGRSAGGPGLGLAVCRGIVKALEGEIGVQSAPGEGSCFWVRLPLSLGPPDGSPAKAPARLDVLVVDDNDINRLVTARMMQDLGHFVTEADCGLAACEIAGAQAFDLVLMDIAMAGMDGLTATAKIRREGASASARILALTAHCRPEDIMRIGTAGMDGHIAKPLTRAKLKAALYPTTPCPIPPGPAFDPGRWQDLGLALGSTGRAQLLDQFGAFLDKLPARLHAVSEDGQALRAILHEAIGVAATMGTPALLAVLRRLHDGELPRIDASQLLSQVATIAAQIHTAKPVLSAQSPRNQSQQPSIDAQGIFGNEWP